MEGNLLCVCIAVLSVLVSTNSQTWGWTTPATGLNLNMKMITVSANKGPVSFYPPYYSSDSDIDPARYYQFRNDPTRPYPTRPYNTPNYPWTTTRPTSGVSVCLRYLTDEQASTQTLFLLGKSSSSPLRLGIIDSAYLLTFGQYRTNRLYLKPYINFWPNLQEDIWTRVCITVDSVKNVAQAFRGPNMSIRKRLSAPYYWTGEPVIDFFSFDGQVTDVQIWDYPLRYTEVLQYMTANVYGPSSGSVLSWSYISYSPRENALLEDCYEWQQKKSILKSKGKKWRRPKGEKKTMKFHDQGESKKQQL